MAMMADNDNVGREAFIDGIFVGYIIQDVSETKQYRIYHNYESSWIPKSKVKVVGQKRLAYSDNELYGYVLHKTENDYFVRRNPKPKSRVYVISIANDKVIRDDKDGNAVYFKPNLKYSKCGKGDGCVLSVRSDYLEHALKKRKRYGDPNPSRGAPRVALATRAARKSAPVSRKKKRRKPVRTFSIYIYKVLKQVHPDIGMSKKAMGIMNTFVNDMFERLASEAGSLCKYNKRATITSREIETACRLIIPGELAKHALSEGTKCVVRCSYWFPFPKNYQLNLEEIFGEEEAKQHLAFLYDFRRHHLSQGKGKYSDYITKKNRVFTEEIVRQAKKYFEYGEKRKWHPSTYHFHKHTFLQFVSQYHNHPSINDMFYFFAIISEEEWAEKYLTERRFITFLQCYRKSLIPEGFRSSDSESDDK